MFSLLPIFVYFSSIMKLLHYIILIIFSFLILTACKKEYSCETCLDRPVIIPDLPVLADSLLYYQLNINGKYYETIAYNNNNFIVGNGYHNLNNIDQGLAFSSAIIQPNTTTQPLAPLTFSLYRGILKNFSSMTELQYSNFFAIGTYPFVDLKDSSQTYVLANVNGVALLWVDNEAIIWRTDNNPATQSGSFFKIISKEEVFYFGVITGMQIRIVAEFNCKLYNKTGKMIEINKGKIAYYFHKF